MSTVTPREPEGLPLYRVVKVRLKEIIRAERLGPGDQIPSEQKLCAELKVSRGTMRTAISDLVREGVLQRRQGRGTFVAAPKFERSLLHYFRFIERDSPDAVVPESRILQAAREEPPQPVAEALGLRPEERVVRLVRLRSIRGQPCILQTSYFPERLFPDLDQIPPDAPSLYDYIWDRYRVQVAHIEEYLTAGMPDSEARRLLRLESSSPVIIIERKTFAFDEVPVELRRSIGRADRFYYRVRL